MPAPCYADLGKAARDLFSKGYHFGIYKLECKTKTPNNVQFTANGEHVTEKDMVFGTIESQYKRPEYGLSLKEKWTTDNLLTSEFTIEDQLFKGYKLTLEASFSPQTSKKTGKVKNAYKHENFHLNCDADLNFQGPILHGAAVLHYQGWLAGYQMSFDSGKKQLTKSNFAVGYSTDQFTAHAHANDGVEFGGSFYQKVNQQLESGIMLSWAAGTPNTRFALAGKYTLDDYTTLKGKINNSSQIGIGITQAVKKGVKFTVSTLIDGKSLNQGGHKIGMAMELEA